MPSVHHRIPKVHFEDHAPPAGALGAPIVLCHGLLCTSAVWDGVIGSLRAGRRVLTIGLRGHGASGAERSALTFDDLVDDVLAVLDHACIDAAILGGTSLGGMIALRLAARAPRRAAALVLIGAQARAETAESKIRYRTTMRAAQRLGARAALRGLATVMFGPTTRRARPDLVAAWIDACATADPAAMLPVIEAAIERDDALAWLPRITCPALVLRGEEDALVSAETSAEIARELASATHATVPLAGHLAPLEQPEETARRILYFINGLSPSVAG